MELVKDSIKCASCSNFLDKPVLLPCGHSVCKQHETDKRWNGKKTIFCSICFVRHDIPENGFTPIRALESLIEKKIELIDFGEEYNSAWEKCKQFDDVLKSFNRIRNEPNERIEAVIRMLIIKVRSTTSRLILQISSDSRKAVEKLTEYENECKSKAALMKDDVKLKEKLNAWENDLNRWQKQLGTFERDVNRWKIVLAESSSKFSLLNSEYNILDESIFLNRYPQFSDVNIYFGNDLDMIKDNSISIKVENLSHITNDTQLISKESNTVKVLGVEFSLKVQMSKKEDKVGMYLAVKPNSELNRSVSVRYDLGILNRLKSENSLKWNVEKEFQVGVRQSWGFLNNIKLSTLMSNNELYDAQMDSFTAQAIIKDIKWNVTSLY